MTASVASAVGGVMATHGARRLASEQLASAEEGGNAPKTALRRQADLTAGTVRNLGRHAAADLGMRLGGRMARWSGAMDSERQSLKAKARATGQRQMRAEETASHDQPKDRDEGKS